MSNEKYSEGWRDPAIWDKDSSLIQLIRIYLPGAKMPEGVLSATGLMGVGFLYCEGKVREKAATVVDMVYWN